MRPRSFREKNYKREPTALDALTVHIGHRICSAVFRSREEATAKRCDCERRGRDQCCEVMMEAARSAMTEIANWSSGG